jgi:hypothetical protein
MPADASITHQIHQLRGCLVLVSAIPTMENCLDCLPESPVVLVEENGGCANRLRFRQGNRGLRLHRIASSAPLEFWPRARANAVRLEDSQQHVDHLPASMAMDFD